MSSNKQSGFSAVLSIVAVVLVIGVLGVIGWRLYSQPSTKTNDATSNNQTTSKTPTTSTTTPPAQQVDPNAGYFVIKEWGVRLKPVSGLDGLAYALTDSNTAQLTTAQLNGLDPNCSAQKYPVLGGIVKSLEATVASSQALGKVGNYYYYYYTPQGVCSDQTNVRNMQISELADLKASLPSFEAAQ